MARLYSFRMPSDIRSVLSPWRKFLSDKVTGSGDFDTALAQMSDRDRALEDHLNFISQGRLAYAISTSFTTINTGVETDLPDLIVTVTVPANRVLRVTGQAICSVQAATEGQGWISEDGAHVGLWADLSQSGGAANIAAMQSGSVILTPTGGSHTYKLSGLNAGGTFVTGGVAAAPAFILVEDIGPIDV